MEEPNAALIYTTLPDAKTAREIAATLLNEKLIACANILNDVQSVFVWNEQIESTSESALLFKTTAATLQAAVSRLGALHPYETPAIVGSVCDTAHPDTLQWLVEQVIQKTNGTHGAE